MLRFAWIEGLAAAFICALAVRWGAVERASARVLDGDEREYLDLGVNSARIGVLAVEPAVPSAVRGPVGPGWIALAQRGSGPVSLTATRRLQAIVSSCGVFLLFALGLSLDGKRGVYAGLAAAFAFALHPDLAADAALLRTEWIDALFVALLCAAAVGWLREPSRKGSAALGAVLGCALLSRSTLAFALPLIAAAGFAMPGRFGSWRKWFPPLLLGCVLVVLPWAARNAARFEAFIPFERGAAPLILYYTSLGMPASDGLVQYEAMAIAEAPELAEMDSVERMARIGSLARGHILESLGRFLAAALGRLGVLWDGHGLLLGFALVGLIVGRRRPEAWALAAIWAYYNLHMFADVYSLRLHPGLIPLIALASVAVLEFPTLAASLAEFPLPAPVGERWIAACALALAAPALLALAREAAFAYPAGSPGPKVFLDRVVADARAGKEDRALAALEEGAARYPGSAPVHLSHAALLESAGMSARACAALSRAADVVSPLGEYRTELTDRIRAGLSACN